MKYLTFDIEDWFHVLDNPRTKYPAQWESFPKRINIGLDIILDLCSKHRIKGTFFCLGWIAEKYPEEIMKIHNAGHIIGTHGYAHQLVYEQSKDEFREDLLKSISILRQITGEEITSYRAPGFSITKDCLWAFDILCECGIKYDSSVFPASRSHGGLKGVNLNRPFKLLTVKGREIIEFPITTQTILSLPFVFSGGGYFRLFPYVLLKKWFRNADYLMTYFHPRDFDSRQPKIPGLNFIRQFQAYYGITKAERKLNKLLECNSQFSCLQNKISLKSLNVHEINLNSR